MNIRTVDYDQIFNETMDFGRKLKVMRKSKKMTVLSLAKMINIAPRTINNYESGKTYPRDKAMYQALAKALEVPVNYFLSEDSEFMLEARERYGTRSSVQVEKIIKDVTTLFSDGNITEDDKYNMLLAIQNTFWLSRNNNIESFASNMAIKDALAKLDIYDISFSFDGKPELLSTNILKLIMKKSIDYSFVEYENKSLDNDIEEEICFVQYEMLKVIENMFYIYEINDKDELFDIINWLYGE